MNFHRGLLFRKKTAKFTLHNFLNTRLYISLFLVVLSMSLSMRVFGGNDKGTLNLRYYSPLEYKAHAQNLGIAQDQSGVMYFANITGVLRYDGANWSVISLPGAKFASTVATDTLNNIYVGALGELGMLVPNETGKLEYKSLLDKLPKEIESLDRVNAIYAMKDGVYFITRTYILLWSGGAFKTWKSETQFHTSFDVDGQLYVSYKGKGICKMLNGDLQLIGGTDELAKWNIYGITKFNGEIIVTTSDNGIYKLSKGTLEKIPLEIGNIYNAVNVLDTYFVLGLFGDGIVVLNRDFEIEFKFDGSTGLEEGTVHFLFVDQEKNLWAALGRGLAKIEIISPVTIHGPKNGLRGTVQDVVRFKGQLFASTTNGIFYFDENERFFKPLPGISIDCFGMDVFEMEGDTVLLFAGADAIYELKDNYRFNKIFEGAPWRPKQSQTYANRVIVGEEGALSSMVRKDGIWVPEGIVEGIDGNIYDFVEEKNGTLWLGSLDGGVIKTNTRIFTDKNTPVYRYDTTSGLPASPVYVNQFNDGSIAFGTEKGIYRYNEKTDKFTPDPQYRIESKTDITAIHRMAMDYDGQIWASVYYDQVNSDILFFRDGIWQKTPFLRYNSEIFHSIYHEPNGITWLGSAYGLLRFDHNFFKQYDFPFKVRISRIVTGNKPIFEGYFTGGEGKIVVDQPETFIPELPYSKNNLLFEFAAPTYFDESGTKYSYILEGQSDEWSDWSTLGKATFTNIHEGKYVFKVKATNIYGTESGITTFSFIVLPPWYRTIWAYIGYIILFIAFVWGAISVSTRSLKRIIQERTAEIVQQKEEIEMQKTIVEEKNKDILDSIKYAKRIQDAILPGEDHMRDVIGRDLFVLYRPKDIVSGDFYWIKVKGPKVLFAAVDCTGHGVPGAFVSIVGNNNLNRAVNEFGLTKPAEVLDNLAVNVEDSFRQQGHSEVRDGMDISLCSFEMTGFNTARLEWSGANNPLWIVKAEDPTQIIEIKADKQPIGKFENRKPFTNHSFDLVKGDTIYVFTDGYADQFGGPAGKKFKYAQLKELLLAMQDKPMPEQREILLEKFTEWMSGMEQIDDVCIIGLRV